MLLRAPNGSDPIGALAVRYDYAWGNPSAFNVFGLSVDLLCKGSNVATAMPDQVLSFINRSSKREATQEGGSKKLGSDRNFGYKVSMDPGQLMIDLSMFVSE